MQLQIVAKFTKWCNGQMATVTRVALSLFGSHLETQSTLSGRWS